MELVKDKFSKLQEDFAIQYSSVFNDTLAEKAIVVIPSLTLDKDILSKIDGIVHYEERLLCLLMLLRMPKTHVIYVTSTPVDDVIIDYYLHLLPGITRYHAKKRLHFLSCSDTTSKSLTEKILEQPALVQKIKSTIPAGFAAHLACFNVTYLEKELALQLQLPIYGCNPNLWYWGTKSGSRSIFKTCGIPVPKGFEDLQNEEDIIDGLTALYIQNPGIKKAVVKMNDGFSGDGNAIFAYHLIDKNIPIKEQIKNQLPKILQPVAKNLTYMHFIEKFISMGGIVEEFVVGHPVASPSVQCRINPLGKIDIISTHDQILGGEDGQIFLGACFPAENAYSIEIGALGLKVAEQLKEKGVLGRFAIDFLSVKENDQWIHYAIEINLRKGGTTHPYIMLQFLTDGNYCADKGNYLLPNGEERYYIFTDNLQDPVLKGLSPADLLDIAIYNGLHYDSTKQEGVMFHMIGALMEYGKLGIICIGESYTRAKELYKKTMGVLGL
ncbi:MAG: hypothetical protein KA319_08510 [Ferruginibacter sp.]|nr:hypothetical protein [Ferruginibacter sp.]